LQPPPAQEMLDLYFSSFPQQWKAAWFAQGQSIHSAIHPTQEITDFMHAQEICQVNFMEPKKFNGKGNETKKNVVSHHHAKAKYMKKGQGKQQVSGSSNNIIMDGN
jgi:hypothetical protein